MKSDGPIPRRRFLLTSAGAVAGIESLCAPGPSSAEETKVPRKSHAEIARIVAELDAKAAEFMNPPKADGQLVNLLVKASRARNVLELGTAYGYATIWLALGLEETGGQLRTLEIKPDRLDTAKRHVAAAGLSRRVDFNLGDAHQLLQTLAGPFDLVLLDADKGGYLDYFEKLYPKKLAPGALLVAHGAIQLREKMKDYLDAIGANPKFDTVTVSATMDDGFALSYRKRD